MKNLWWSVDWWYVCAFSENNWKCAVCMCDGICDYLKIIGSENMWWNLWFEMDSSCWSSAVGKENSKFEFDGSCRSTALGMKKFDGFKLSWTDFLHEWMCFVWVVAMFLVLALQIQFKMSLLFLSHWYGERTWFLLSNHWASILFSLFVLKP